MDFRILYLVLFFLLALQSVSLSPKGESLMAILSSLALTHIDSFGFEKVLVLGNGVSLLQID